MVRASRTTRWPVAIALVAAALAAAAVRPRVQSPAPGSQPAPGGRVDAYIAAEMAAKRIPGVSVAVIRDGAVVHLGHYGMASVELSVPVTSESVLHPGTKPGFSSAFTRFLDDRLTVIALCNTSSGAPAFALSLGIADLYLGHAGRPAE